MKKKNNVMMVATIAITLLMIGCVIVMGIIRNSNRNNPDVRPPEQTTDTTPPNQTTPEIPPISDDGKKDSATKPGEVSIDVEQPVDESRNDKPGIDGDVAIIPGVKGERE